MTRSRKGGERETRNGLPGRLHDDGTLLRAGPSMGQGQEESPSFPVEEVLLAERVHAMRRL